MSSHPENEAEVGLVLIPPQSFAVDSIHSPGITLPYVDNAIDGEIVMQTVTVSPKFQVVIPKAVRDQLHIKPGQKMIVMPYGEHIQFVPVKTAKELRGLLKGCDLDMDSIRDKSDRF